MRDRKADGNSCGNDRAAAALAAARPLAIIAALAAFGCGGPGGAQFSVTFGADRSPEPLDGRLVLMLSQDDAAEPRFQIVDGPDSQLAFGVDVEGWAPEEPVTVDGGAFGYPTFGADRSPGRPVGPHALPGRCGGAALPDRGRPG